MDLKYKLCVFTSNYEIRCPKHHTKALDQRPKYKNSHGSVRNFSEKNENYFSESGDLYLGLK